MSFCGLVVLRPEAVAGADQAASRLRAWVAAHGHDVEPLAGLQPPGIAYGFTLVAGSGYRARMLDTEKARVIGHWPARWAEGNVGRLRVDQLTSMTASDHDGG